MKKIIIAGAVTLGVLLTAGVGIAYYFTSLALRPAWQRPGLDWCPPHRGEKTGWGKQCGNLRLLKTYKFEETKFPTERGLELPAWFVPAGAAKRGLAGACRGRRGSCAVFFMHGGGADRREGYRFLKYFHERGYDYYMPDMHCHGESKCPEFKLSFGAREHQDVIDIYRVLKKKYKTVIAMGTSVGATSVLIALPKLEGVKAVIAENPMYSTGRFIQDTEAAPAFLPGWYRSFLHWSLQKRGGFDSSNSAAVAVGKVTNVPIYFVHGTKDSLFPPSHSQGLHDLYKGPKAIRVIEGGKHARLWNFDPAAFEKGVDEFLKTHMK